MVVLQHGKMCGQKCAVFQVYSSSAFRHGMCSNCGMRQTTLANSVARSGIGLHSGRSVRLVLKPAAVNTGIRFALPSRSGRRIFRLGPDVVTSTAMATTLGHGQETVGTVEHLLAALRGLGVDNALVEVDGGEVPVLDGSALELVQLVRRAGLRLQDAPRTVYALTREVAVRRENKWIVAEPSDTFEVDYTIDFPHPAIGRQQLCLEVTPQTFAEQLAPARTFGFAHQIQALRDQGLALGGSLDNAVLLDDNGVVNEDGLRFADECVRHKMLDFVGDLAVFGAPVLGRFSVFASGHSLNIEFVRELAANAQDCLKAVEAPLGTPVEALAGHMAEDSAHARAAQA